MIPAFEGNLLDRVSQMLAVIEPDADVTPATSGISTFVESSRPPSPASITATSAPARAK
jgi:hypothetical protein